MRANIACDRPAERLNMADRTGQKYVLQSARSRSVPAPFPLRSRTSPALVPAISIRERRLLTLIVSGLNEKLSQVGKDSPNIVINFFD